MSSNDVGPTWVSDQSGTTRVRIKSGWDNAGRTGTVIGRSVKRGQWWSPVIWDDEEDPDWHKTVGLEALPPSKEHHIAITVRSDKQFLDVMCETLRIVREHFGGGQASASGVDLAGLHGKLAATIEERNLAVAESHRLRLELELIERKRIERALEPKDRKIKRSRKRR